MPLFCNFRAFAAARTAATISELWTEIHALSWKTSQMIFWSLPLLLRMWCTLRASAATAPFSPVVSWCRVWPVLPFSDLKFSLLQHQQWVALPLESFWKESYHLSRIQHHRHGIEPFLLLVPFYHCVWLFLALCILLSRGENRKRQSLDLLLPVSVVVTFCMPVSEPFLGHLQEQPFAELREDLRVWILRRGVWWVECILPLFRRWDLVFQPVGRSWRWPRARLWPFEHWLYLLNRKPWCVPWR